MHWRLLHMKINERLYPHPVQSHFSDDIINCQFQSTPRIDTGKNIYKFSVVARTSSADLQKLIQAHKAAYALHIECATTRFRKLITSFNSDFQEDIRADYLEGRVELCSLVIATEDIEDYTNKNFHPDYGVTSFAVKKGDVLAVAQDRFFDAIKENDPLSNISSIFKVRRNTSSEENVPFTVELMGESIVILLSEENFHIYSDLKRDDDKHSTLASMIILPALVYVIETIKSQAGDDSSFLERRWYRVIHKKLKEKGFNLEDIESLDSESSLVIAQMLVGDPVSTALKTMLAIEENMS